MRFTTVLRILATGLVIQLSALMALAQQPPSGPPSGQPPVGPSDQDAAPNELKQRLDVLQLEKVRADIRVAQEQLRRSQTELEKARKEMEKLDRDAFLWWTTPAAIIVPLLLGVGTLWWQGYNQNRSKQAELELKVVDLVMESSAPYAAYRRWSLLRGIYLDRLSRNFVRNMDETKFENFPGVRLPEMRMALFNALSQRADSQDKVVAAFARVYPEEIDRAWFSHVQAGPAGSPSPKD